MTDEILSPTPLGSSILEIKIRDPISLGDIKNAIVTDYDIKDTTFFKPIPKGLQSKNYVFANTDQQYLLKIYPEETSSEHKSRLGNTVRLEQAIRDAGVPISETIQTTSGRYWSSITRKVGMTHNEKVVFSVSRFFDGSPLTNPTV